MSVDNDWLQDRSKVTFVRNLIAPLFPLVDIISWKKESFKNVAERYIDAGIATEDMTKYIGFKFGKSTTGVSSLTSLFEKCINSNSPKFPLSLGISVSKDMWVAIAREFRSSAPGKVWNKVYVMGASCPDDSFGNFLHLIQTSSSDFGSGSVYAIVRGSDGCADIVLSQSAGSGTLVVKRYAMLE